MSQDEQHRSAAVAACCRAKHAVRRCAWVGVQHVLRIRAVQVLVQSSLQLGTVECRAQTRVWGPVVV
jgi:hypothetical protein